MSVYRVVYNILSNDTATTNVVGSKIYPVQAPQETTFPFVVFNTISVIPTNTKGASGQSTMDRYRMQVTALVDSNNFPQLDTLTNSIRTALEGIFMETVSSVFVQSITYQNQNDTYDAISSQDGVYLRNIDFFITISR